MSAQVSWIIFFCVTTLTQARASILLGTSRSCTPSALEEAILRRASIQSVLAGLEPGLT
jgi:hypothetical protein